MLMSWTNYVREISIKLVNVSIQSALCITYYVGTYRRGTLKLDKRVLNKEKYDVFAQ